MSAKILIIDDETIVRNLLVKYLNMQGFNTISAENGFEGVKMAKVHDPDLIILDLLMPGIDGYETANRIKADSRLKEKPIIYLSAMAQESDNDPARSRSEVFIVKPVGFKKLMNTVQHLIIQPDTA